MSLFWCLFSSPQLIWQCFIYWIIRPGNIVPKQKNCIIFCFRNSRISSHCEESARRNMKLSWILPTYSWMILSSSTMPFWAFRSFEMELHVFPKTLEWNDTKLSTRKTFHVLDQFFIPPLMVWLVSLCWGMFATS